MRANLSVYYAELSRYEDALCKAIKTSDEVLLTNLDFHFELLAWPHPSGLNRWHNETQNKILIKRTFPIVRRHLTEAL